MASISTSTWPPQRCVSFLLLLLLLLLLLPPPTLCRTNIKSQTCVSLSATCPSVRGAPLSRRHSPQSSDAEEEALRAHFDACGAIEYVRLVRDKETNVGKGIGYVKFAVRRSLRSFECKHQPHTHPP